MTTSPSSIRGRPKQHTEDEHIKSIPVRHYGQLISAVLLLVLTGALVSALAQNDKLDYSVFAEYVFSESVLKGLAVTFQLSIISMAIGLVLGGLIAVARMSTNRLLQSLAALYVWFFRGVPLLAQLLIWGNLGLLFSHLGVGVPFTSIMLFEVETNAVITTFVASILGLALHEAAYMAEIIRGGILAVDPGQREAATALGMTGSLAMRRIILPQALRVIIPPTANQFISLIKASSLVAVIAGGELMTATNEIGSHSFKIIEALMIAAFWYLVIVSILNSFQRLLERRLSRGFNR